MPYKNPQDKAAWMKENRPNYVASKLAWERNDRRDSRLSRPFIGVDGEGYDLPTGEHVYNMLCASGGEYIVDHKGLTFESCVSFLLMLKAKYPTAIFVGFSFNYDVNMILKSKGLDWINDRVLNPEAAILAGRLPGDYKGYTLNQELGGYLYLDWKPRKTLTLKLSQKTDKRPGMIVYDVFGFFQSSFYRALVDNQIGDKTTVDLIESMKRERGTFDPTQWERVKDYSVLECKLLVELMDKLRSLISGLKDTELKLDLPMSRWDGAGAIAAELMKHYKVKAHRWPLDRMVTPLHKGIDGVERPAIMYAYFGGRFESPMLGILRKTYGYDINSAYPEAMFWLPCLRNARFERIAPDAWDRRDITLSRVTWKLPGDTIICPFPFRDAQGRISFPVNGSGWYWSYEVKEALARFGEPDADGYGVELMEVYKLVTDSKDCDCGGLPFQWIQDIYEYRRILKERGDARQLPLKLGANSCYGKLAQGVGAAPFQDFAWAGMITSHTRGKILAAIYRNKAEKYVAQIATDGIEFTKPQPLVCGDSLGQWEYSEAEDVFIAGNGLVNYQCPKCKGVPWDGSPPACSKCGGRGMLQKVRGFSKGERIDWELLRSKFLENGPGASIPVNLNRFVGAQLAIHLNDKTMFARWLRVEKKFTVQLRNRSIRLAWGRISVETGGRIPSRKRQGGRLWLTDPIGTHLTESYPHRPKAYKGLLESEEDIAQIIDAELSAGE